MWEPVGPLSGRRLLAAAVRGAGLRDGPAALVLVSAGGTPASTPVPAANRVPTGCGAATISHPAGGPTTGGAAPTTRGGPVTEGARDGGPTLGGTVPAEISHRARRPPPAGPRRGPRRRARRRRARRAPRRPAPRRPASARAPRRPAPPRPAGSEPTPRCPAPRRPAPVVRHRVVHRHPAPGGRGPRLRPAPDRSRRRPCRPGRAPRRVTPGQAVAVRRPAGRAPAPPANGSDPTTPRARPGRRRPRSRCRRPARFRAPTT